MLRHFWQCVLEMWVKTPNFSCCFGPGLIKYDEMDHLIPNWCPNKKKIMIFGSEKWISEAWNWAKMNHNSISCKITVRNRVSKFPKILVPVPTPKFNYLWEICHQKSPKVWLCLSQIFPQNPWNIFSPSPNLGENWGQSFKSSNFNLNIFLILEMSDLLNWWQEDEGG